MRFQRQMFPLLGLERLKIQTEYLLPKIVYPIVIGEHRGRGDPPRGAPAPLKNLTAGTTISGF